MLIVHSPRCLDYAAFGHPERPERVSATVARLRADHHTWLEPQPATDADLLRVHTPEHLRAVQTGDYFNADTPHFDNINHIARLAAGAALLAAEHAVAGQTACSLMRPPGHHATRDEIMGFCYFNNLAIAVAAQLAAGKVNRVAIVDFDCHHGNGTEDIVTGNDAILFVSLHQSPCYPGTGQFSHHNCHNYPLPPGTGPAEYLAAFDGALDKVRAFHPDLLAVSAGFDAYQGDPITDMGLEVQTFGAIGARLAALHVPTFAVLEGGYAPALPECIAQFVTQLAPGHATGAK
jgi:acetoin utilization deacetylase AcuC-like enzyme